MLKRRMEPTFFRRQFSIVACLIMSLVLPSHVALGKGNAECIEWIPKPALHEVISRNAAVDTADSQTLDFSLCKASDDEIGIFDEENGHCAIFSSSTKNITGYFEVAKLRPDLCFYFWKPISFDVNPLNTQALIVGLSNFEDVDTKASPSSSDLTKNLETQLPTNSKLSLCKYGAKGETPRVGIMFLSGPLLGHCQIQSTSSTDKTLVGGGYAGFSAWPLSVSTPSSTSQQEEHREIYSNIKERVDLYITEEDKFLISKITLHPFDELMNRLANVNEISIHTLRNVLSTTPFVPSELNNYGLSLLRSILAERMTLARRRRYNLHLHPDTDEWETNGVLLKDFDYYAHPSKEHELRLLLQMCGAIQNITDVPYFEWSEVKVVSYDEDPQLQPHIDTFHSVVKMWVYEREVVTLEHGPLHFMRGSNINDESRLRWIYNVTKPPALDAMAEASLRYKGDPFKDGMPDFLRPVLPLDSFKKTLIIADTSGIHHRGYATPGIVRQTYRVQPGLDGGLARTNPFDWDGWDGTSLSFSINVSEMS